MNVTRASRTGASPGPFYTLLSAGIGPFLILSFAGTVYGLYSGTTWIILVIGYIVFTLHMGVKNE